MSSLKKTLFITVIQLGILSQPALSKDFRKLKDIDGRASVETTESRDSASFAVYASKLKDVLTKSLSAPTSYVSAAALGLGGVLAYYFGGAKTLASWRNPQSNTARLKKSYDSPFKPKADGTLSLPEPDLGELSQASMFVDGLDPHHSGFGSLVSPSQNLATEETEEGEKEAGGEKEQSGEYLLIDLLNNMRPILESIPNFPSDHVGPYLTMVFEVYGRLQRRLSSEEIQQIYSENLNEDDLTHAPAILLGQRHTEREGILNNLVMTAMALTDDTTVLVEGFTPTDEVYLLTDMLSSIGYADYLDDHLSVGYYSDEGSVILRALGIGASALLNYFREQNFQFPLLNVVATGWDAENYAQRSSAFRNYHLARNIMLHQRRRLIVHLGVAHIPRRQELLHSAQIERDHRASLFNLRATDVFLSRLVCKDVPVSFTQASLIVLRNTLPIGSLELAPGFFSGERQDSGILQLCANLCGRAVRNSRTEEPSLKCSYCRQSQDQEDKDSNSL